jgi:hypothetical protein
VLQQPPDLLPQLALLRLQPLNLPRLLSHHRILNLFQLSLLARGRHPQGIQLDLEGRVLPDQLLELLLQSMFFGG